MHDPLLDIQDLRVAFHAGSKTWEAVSGVNLSINRGEVVALVGESGSGKTVTALTVTRLLPSPPVAYVRGRVLFDGQDTVTMSETDLRKLRGRRIAYVFQEPATALNPVFTNGFQIAEALKLHGINTSVSRKISELLESVGIPDPQRVARAYPHQISGGQQQRVMLAIALACEPDLLIADEPTTALDVTVQAQILDLLKTLQAARGMAVLLITHNLAIAAQLAQRVIVMYAGQNVESGSAIDILRSPRHPYTRALLHAVPRLRGQGQKLDGIPGQIPSGLAWPSGCRFHPRCSMSREKCSREPPISATVSDRQSSRCWFWPEVRS